MIRSIGRQRAVLIFLSWTLIGVFLGSNNYRLEEHLSPHPRGWQFALTDGLLFAELWFVLDLAIIHLCWRYPLARGALRRHLPFHVVAAVALSLVHLGLYLPLTAFANRFLGGNPAGMGDRLDALRTLLPWNLVIYAAICVIASAVDYSRRLRDSEAAAARLAVQLAEARVSALEAQIHPHFLFNALHSIMVLMHQDVDAASAMLTRLGELLRHGLAATATQEAELHEELDFALDYLAVEQVRFGDRLRVATDVDPALRHARVPRLLIQPLVENAVRHGIGRIAGDGRISITVAASAGALCLEVTDTGPGPSAQPPDGAMPGLGLANTLERLRLLYGEAAALTLARATEGGAVVRVTLPLRLSPDSPPATGRET